MPDVTILTERELRRCVEIDEAALSVVSDAFVALARGEVVMPPILRLDIADNNGEIDVKTAYMRGLDSFAVKMSPGFFDNPKLGLPSVTGMMVLFSAKTGLLEAVLLDNGYLTDVRTAAAGGVAARHLAPADCRTAGVIGTGTQARLQIRALKLVRDFERLLVWGRDPEKAAAYAAEMGPALGVEAATRDTAAGVVRESQAVVTTTPARTALIAADCLHPGLHITAMGSDAEHKNEIAPEVIAAVDAYVCDARSQVARLGELRHALAAGAVAEDHPAIELGEVIGGAEAGRPSAEAVTLCDLTGTGVQDTAIALHAFRRARAAGLGSVIET